METSPTTAPASSTNSPEVASTTTPPDPDAGWVSEPTLGPSDVAGITGVDSGTLGTYVVTKSTAQFRYIFRRGADGWESVHEIPISGEAIPETHVAVGFGAVVVMQSGDHMAALFGEHHRLSVSVSNDGLDWVTQAPVGLPDNLVIADIAVTASGFVAAGWVRGEGSTGTTRIWESIDGVDWSEVIRWSRDDVAIESLAGDGEVVVAVGEADRKSASWSSADGWQLHRFMAPIPSRLGSVTAVSGSFYVVGQPRAADRFFDGPFLMVSTDGIVWSSLDEEKRPFPRLLGPISGGTQLAVLGNDLRLVRHRNYCFLYGCGFSNVVLYTFSPDQGWHERPVPTEDDGSPAAGVMEANGTLLLVGTRDGELAVWHETEAVEVTGIKDDPDLPEIPYEWVERDVDVDLEVGVVYAMRVGTHCGIIHLANWQGIDWWVRDGWQYPPDVDYLNETLLRHGRAGERRPHCLQGGRSRVRRVRAEGRALDLRLVTVVVGTDRQLPPYCLPEYPGEDIHD